MAIEAELADGRILEFPDGTKPEVIQATVKRVLGIQAAPTATATPAAESFTTGDPMGGLDLGLSSAMAPPPEKKSALDVPGPSTPVPQKDLMLRPEFVGGIKAQIGRAHV